MTAILSTGEMSFSRLDHLKAILKIYRIPALKNNDDDEYSGLFVTQMQIYQVWSGAYSTTVSPWRSVNDHHSPPA